MGYQSKALEAIAEILKAYTDVTDSRPWQIAYSGGKDSTVTTALMFRAMLALPRDRRKRKVYITSAQTGLDLTTDPTKQREYQKMQQLIDKHSLPVQLVETEPKLERSFLFLVLGKGYPLPKNSRRDRWCTSIIKIEPQEKFMKQHFPALTILGVRSSESETRAASIENVQVSKYFGERTDKKGKVLSRTLMPIVDFTLEDVWGYLAEQGTPWGDAEEISQLYKDATGECGLRRRKAGGDEDNSDACGARFGCIICPVVKIDRSSQEMAKKKPWYQPYVDLRNIMIKMYEDPTNRSGTQRNGRKLAYGQGAFTVKARMKLLKLFLEAQDDNKRLALLYGMEPQPIIDDGMLALIQNQWQEDLQEKPWLEDGEELGLFYEEFIKGLNAFQLTWNHLYEIVI